MLKFRSILVQQRVGQRWPRIERTPSMLEPDDGYLGDGAGQGEIRLQKDPLQVAQQATSLASQSPVPASLDGCPPIHSDTAGKFFWPRAASTSSKRTKEVANISWHSKVPFPWLLIILEAGV